MATMDKSVSASAPAPSPGGAVAGSSELVDVVVIGGGISGLRAASELTSLHGYKVVVLEARGKIGGRVNEDWTFLPGRPIELGAEFIHGDANPIVELTEAQGWSRRHLFTWSHGDGGPAEAPAPDGGIGFYYLGKERALHQFDSEDTDLHLCSEALWRLADAQPDAAEADPRSLLAFLRDEGVPERMLGLACAGYGNTAGGTAASVPVSKAMRLERAWNADGSEIDPDFRMEPSFHVLIQHLARGLDVRTHSPVKSIDVSAAARARERDAQGARDAVTVTTQDGRVVRAARAVVAVPLPVLKDGDMVFSPPLSARKRAALDSMGFSNGVKIVLQFSSRPWPANCHGVVCADSFIPEMWMNSSEGVGALIVGSTCSFAASALSHIQLDVSADVAAEEEGDVGGADDDGVDGVESSSLCADDEVGSVISSSLFSGRTPHSRVKGATTHASSLRDDQRDSPMPGSPTDAGATAEAAAADARANAYIVTGFVMGTRADEMLSAHSQPTIIARMLSQMDDMFAKHAEGGALPRPSEVFKSGFVHNWAREPFIRGAYSTPTFAELPDAAKRLAEPHADSTVFFAGEAVAGAVDGRVRHLPAHRQHFASPIVMHGAMNTGSIAACDVARSLGAHVCCDPDIAAFSPTYIFQPEEADPDAPTDKPRTPMVWRQAIANDPLRAKGVATARGPHVSSCTDKRRAMMAVSHVRSPLPPSRAASPPSTRAPSPSPPSIPEVAFARVVSTAT